MMRKRAPLLFFAILSLMAILAPAAAEEVAVEKGWSLFSLPVGHAATPGVEEITASFELFEYDGLQALQVKEGAPVAGRGYWMHAREAGAIALSTPPLPETDAVSVSL